MADVSNIKINGTSYALKDAKAARKGIYVGTCTTAAATAPKVATTDAFPLDGDGKPLVGTIVAIKFVNTNSYKTAGTTMTLEVNSTGAYPIYYNNAEVVSTTSANTLACGYKNRYIYYMFNGTHWVWLTASYDTNSTYSGMTTAEIEAGTGTTARLITPKNLRDYFYTEDEVDDLLADKADADDLAPVATSGSYNDLTNKPTIPAAVTVDSSLTGSSQTNPVQGGAIYSALQGKEDRHIFLNLEEDANDNLVFTDLDGNTIVHTQVLEWLENKSASVRIDYDGTMYEMQTGGEDLWRGIYYDGDYFAYINLQGADYPITTLEFEDKGEIYLASHNWAQNRFVPQARKINNKPLSTDITLTASDVGALPNTTTIPTKVSDLTNDSGFITGYTETDPVFAASAAHGISSADISSWDGKADPVTIVTVSTTGAVTQALDPNKFYDFTGSPTSLTLTLTSGTGLCIYAGKFTAGTGFTNLSFPATVKVADGAPSVEAGNTYEFSVMNNLLLLAKEGS